MTNGRHAVMVPGWAMGIVSMLIGLSVTGMLLMWRDSYASDLKIADHDPLAAEDIGTSERMHEIPSYELPAAPGAPGAPTSAWGRWVRATRTLAQSGFKRSKPLARAGVGKIRGAGRRISNYLRAHGVLPRPNRSTAASRPRICIRG